jgi:hypothetical protein
MINTPSLTMVLSAENKPKFCTGNGETGLTASVDFNVVVLCITVKWTGCGSLVVVFSLSIREVPAHAGRIKPKTF